jgi:hypothetical protein
MSQIKKPAKEYNIVWLADDGERIILGSVISSNPKDVLFNAICKMIVEAPYHFSVGDVSDGNLRNLIQTGNGPREHYFATIGGQVLSAIEMSFHLN